LVRATDPLQIREKAAGFDDDELSPPRKSGGSLDGSVDTTVSVPVTGDEIHIRADYNSTVVYLDGTAGSIEMLLNVDITRIG
jgi:hypothetical protein